MSLNLWIKKQIIIREDLNKDKYADIYNMVKKYSLSIKLVNYISNYQYTFWLFDDYILCTGTFHWKFLCEDSDFEQNPEVKYP